MQKVIIAICAARFWQQNGFQISDETPIGRSVGLMGCCTGNKKTFVSIGRDLNVQLTC
jgi:hypothetical protein